MSSTIIWSGFTVNQVGMFGFVSGNESKIDLYAWTGAVSDNTTAPSQHTLFSNTSNLRVSITYQVA
jgi:hypothetical protein